jgi:NADH-quinone oxidoreductase subunit H
MDAILEPFRDFMSSQLFVSVHVLLIMLHVILLLGVAYLVYLERKISSYIQDRIGPNRVGFDFGLPFLKFLSTDGPAQGPAGVSGSRWRTGSSSFSKRTTRRQGGQGAVHAGADGHHRAGVDRVRGDPVGRGVGMPPIGEHPDRGPDRETLFGPIGGEEVLVAGADVSIGIVYLLAVASLGVYGVTLGGWASNSKYSFLGGLRATAQMISYEIPLGLSLHGGAAAGRDGRAAGDHRATRSSTGG